ncbi:family 33 glycosyltransferase, partial [Melampsora larici-populina 98AG31]
AKTVTIVVLGDLGRSPRMMRHAVSFADHDWSVNILAYPGTTLPKKLTEHLKIRILPLSEPPRFISDDLPRRLFVLIGGPLKAIYLSLNLLYSLLLHAQDSSYVMVQNPPAIPTLPMVQLARLVLGFKLIIDWHNTAYSILALKVGSDRHPMVRVAELIEKTFGRIAHLHLFVTEAERVYLSKTWQLQGKTHVFYDRPPLDFCRLTVDEIHQLWERLPLSKDPAVLSTFYPSHHISSHETLVSMKPTDTSAHLKPNRPALIVSSTSWTHDEDFSILINALSIYTKSKKDNPNLPSLLCLITGKGPLKEFYRQEIAKRDKDEKWGSQAVKCELVWLDDVDDYKRLLGSCDLGISLHQSSSGLDLPMKVVDMFGCGLPVCARNFACISELVKHNKNGLVFDTEAELASQLESLLSGFPDNQLEDCQLNKLRDGINSNTYGVNKRAWSNWDEEWEQNVL